MTVPSTQTKVTYNGNGVTTAFAFPIYFLADADIVVQIEDAVGNVTEQTLTTDYTLTGAGVQTGGTVTMIVPPASGEMLIVFRDPVDTQETDFQDFDIDPADAKEDAFDRRTMVSQRQAEQISRSLVLKESSSFTGLTVPEPSANKTLAWNAAATGLTNGPTSDEVSNAQAYATAAGVSAASALVSENNAAASELAASGYEADVNAAGAAQIVLIGGAGDSELAQIAAAGDSELSQVAAAGDSELAAITGEGGAQVARIILSGALDDRQSILSDAHQQWLDETFVGSEGPWRVTDIVDVTITAQGFTTVGIGEVSFVALTDGVIFGSPATLSNGAYGLLTGVSGTSYIVARGGFTDLWLHPKHGNVTADLPNGTYTLTVVQENTANKTTGTQTRSEIFLGNGFTGVDDLWSSNNSSSAYPYWQTSTAVSGRTVTNSVGASLNYLLSDSGGANGILFYVGDVVKITFTNDNAGEVSDIKILWNNSASTITATEGTTLAAGATGTFTFTIPSGFINNYTAFYSKPTLGNIPYVLTMGDMLVTRANSNATAELYAALNASRDDSSKLNGSQNLLTAPFDFTDAAWDKLSVAVTANSAVAPNNTRTADKIYPTTATISSLIGHTETVSGAAGEKHTASGFIHKGNTANVTFNCYFTGGANGEKNVDVDWATLYFNPSIANTFFDITDIGGGWYYWVMTVEAVDTFTSFSTRVWISGRSQTVTTSDYIYLWGLEHIAGDTPTSITIDNTTPLTDIAPDPLFTQDGTAGGWLVQAGVTIANGVADCSGTTTGSLVRYEPGAGVLDGNTYLYKVVVDSITTGTVEVYSWSPTAQAGVITAPGTYYFVLTAEAGATQIGIRSVVATDAVVSALSFYEIADIPGAINAGYWNGKTWTSQLLGDLPTYLGASYGKIQRKFGGGDVGAVYLLNSSGTNVEYSLGSYGDTAFTFNVNLTLNTLGFNTAQSYAALGFASEAEMLTDSKFTVIYTHAARAVRPAAVLETLAESNVVHYSNSNSTAVRAIYECIGEVATDTKVFIDSAAITNQTDGSVSNPIGSIIHSRLNPTSTGGAGMVWTNKLVSDGTNYNMQISFVEVNYEAPASTTLCTNVTNPYTAGVIYNPNVPASRLSYYDLLCVKTRSSAGQWEFAEAYPDGAVNFGSASDEFVLYDALIPLNNLNKIPLSDYITTMEDALGNIVMFGTVSIPLGIPSA